MAGREEFARAEAERRMAPARALIEIDQKEIPGFTAGFWQTLYERARQITEVEDGGEGFTVERDAAMYGPGTLARAAQCYAGTARLQMLGKSLEMAMVEPIEWPWDSEWWKPSGDPIRNLQKAAALMVAELDRALAIKKRESVGTGNEGGS